MIITTREVRNLLATMNSLDKDEIERQLGEPLDHSTWETFRDNPFRTFPRCRDNVQIAITRAINARNKTAVVERVA